MESKTISTLLEKTSLEILTECERDRRYIDESIASLEQQERLYIERLEEVQNELGEERRKLQVLEIQQYGAEKVLENKEYDTPLISNVIKKYDKVTIVKNLPYRGETYKGREKFIGAKGVVIDIDKDYEYPYMVEFEDEELNIKGELWKREELEFTKGEW